MTLNIFDLPPLISPMDICTHHQIIIANPQVSMSVINILVRALDMPDIAVHHPDAVPSLRIHLPTKGMSVLSTIPPLHLHSQDILFHGVHLSIHSCSIVFFTSGGGLCVSQP